MAALAVAVIGAAFMATSTAGAQAAGSFTISQTSGPVGTVVKFSGNEGSSCAALSGTAFLEFQRGSEYGDPNEWINVPVSSSGAWKASFVIPSFVGGQAMTQGSLGSDVTPGTWQFGIPTCNASAPIVDFDVTGTTPLPSRFVGMAATPDGKGYWLAQAGGGVYSYGDAVFHGSVPGLGITLAAPIAGIASTSDGGGYWLVGADGGVFAFGDAGYYGSLPQIGVRPAGVIVGIAPTTNGGGYWLVGADGGVFAFGDATYLSNGRDGTPKVALLPTPDGKGYLLPTATGIGPDAIGDAVSQQTSPMPLDALVSGAATTSDAKGYWEVGTDGGVFAFGDADFYGSLPGQDVTPNAPIVGTARTSDGGGYWLVGADGGVFAFGDAGFYGSAGGSGLPWISSPTTTTASGAPVLLAGNGVAGGRFGQSQASAVNGLEQVLGSPVKGPTDMAGNCNVDTAEQWSTLTAYFDKGAFVGYGTWAANGEAVPRGNFETAVGLRVGDTITQADQLYGSAFQTSLAQGGSWSVATPEGNLIGYLSAEPNQSGPPPTISSIAAGSVGCPAVTP
ncbi:MAG: hypothetical protein ABSH29_23910 [Acidimicrobiales bacterium]|jgi:hypothetical protein